MQRKTFILHFLSLATGLALCLATAPVSAAESLEQPAVNAVDKDSVHLTNYNQLTPEAQKAYLELPLPAKQMLAKKLQEETTVIPGVLSINHKKAFIKGKAIGKDVFDFMKGYVDRLVTQGEVKAEWAPSVHNFFETARTLTPEQRAAWAELFVRDAELSGT